MSEEKENELFQEIIEMGLGLYLYDCKQQINFGHSLGKVNPDSLKETIKKRNAALELIKLQKEGRIKIV